MKQRIRLTEGQLHSIIRNCVNEISSSLVARAKRAALDKYNDAKTKENRSGFNGTRESDKRMRQMKVFNDEWNKRTNNCTKLPDDMTEDEFQTQRKNNFGYKPNTNLSRRSRMNRIVKESVKMVLRENYEDEYPFYVSADINSDYFKTFDEAYQYALDLAKKERDWYEVIDVMDNVNWETLVSFTEDGIHDFTEGTFTPALECY